jgi:clan AA aspartic protease (TIGR02281 family)
VRAVLFLVGVLVGAVLVWALGLPRPGGPSRFDADGQVPDAAWAQVTADPDNASGWAKLADSQATAGHVQRAARSFATAVALAPADAELRARYGFVLYELGDDDLALQQLRQARDLGSKAAMLDFTVTTLGSRLDETGPFPRFIDKSAGPRVAAAPADEDRDRAASGQRAPAPIGAAAASAPAPPPTPPQEAAADVSDDGDEDADVEEGEARDDDLENEMDDEEAPPDEGWPEGEDAQDDETLEEEDDDRYIEPQRPAPPRVAACTIPLRPRGRYGTFVADVVVGRREASLVFDTGATLTVITRDYAVAANVRIDDFNAITVRTANGTTRFATAVIDEIAVGDLVATNIRAAVCDDCGVPGMAGLLGLDVQRQLRLSLDVTEGVARYPCDDPP